MRSKIDFTLEDLEISSEEEDFETNLSEPMQYTPTQKQLKRM